MSKYNTLILSGGSVKTICSLGALQYCHDEQLLDHIDTYIGVSMGGIFAYLLSIGYSVMDIVCAVCSYREIPHFNVLNLAEGRGAIDFTPIQTLLEKMTIEKTGELYTFARLYKKFKKRLVIPVYSLKQMKIIYMSHETHPDMPVLIALRMTTAVPFLFDKVKYGGDEYVDPGVWENLPLEFLDIIKDENPRSIAVYIEPYIFTEETTIGYIHNIMSIGQRELAKFQFNNLDKYNIDIIRINTTVHFFNYFMNSKEKLDLVSDGYRQAQKTFEGPLEIPEKGSEVVEEPVEPQTDDEDTGSSSPITGRPSTS